MKMRLPNKRLGFIGFLMIAAALALPGSAARADVTHTNAPIMGWSTYSQQTIYGANWITEGQIKVQSDMIHQSLQPYGFNYINIDAGSMSGSYDTYGRPMQNTTLYPNGLASLAAYIHNNGQKMGLYHVPGIPSALYDANPPIYGTNPAIHIRDIVKSPYLPGCAWGSTTDQNNYEIDYTKPGAQAYVNSIANLFASWGFDFLKLDGVCPGSNGFGLPSYDQREDVKAWQTALQQCGRQVFLTISWHIDPTYSSFWKQYSNACRIDHDIEAYNPGGVPLTAWPQINNRFTDAVNWCNSSGIGGGWEDLDSLDCGQGSVDGITSDERQTMATFWALECACWYTGDDPYHLDSFGTWLLTNPALIHYDQAGHVANQIQGGNSQIWAAPNGDGTYLVGLFNLGSSSATVTVNWSSLNLTGSQDVFDVLGNAGLGLFNNSFSVTLNSHASKLIKVSGSGVTWYKITSVSNNQSLTVKDGWTVDGGKLITAPDTGSPTQRWQLVSQSNGSYNLVNEFSGKMVNIPGGAGSNGTQLIQYHKDGGSNSQWKKVQSGSNYTFVSVASGLLMDVAGGSIIDEWASNGGTNQQWIITPCVFNDTDTTLGVSYSGTSWFYSSNRNLGDYNNDVHWTNHSGDSCTATFTGTGASFVTEKCNDEGSVSVYVDGVLKTTVNCYNSTRLLQQPVYSISGLTRGTHTLKIVNGGSTNMLIDSFLIAP